MDVPAADSPGHYGLGIRRRMRPSLDAVHHFVTRPSITRHNGREIQSRPAHKISSEPANQTLTKASLRFSEPVVREKSGAITSTASASMKTM